MKTNHKNTNSYAFLSTFLLRHVNTRSLALTMFVALAVQGTLRGNETEQRPSTRGHAQASELSKGSLEVYSARDESSDGDLLYYPHSSYVIYARDGKLFKNVENHLSRSDENPETVSLPIGFYTIVAREDKGGYVRIPV